MVQADISTPEADQQGNVTYTNETSTNAYNASGQRIKRVENGETTNYYYSGGATLFTANANNWLLTENVIDLNGQIITSARFDDQNPGEIEGFYFYHYDMRSSTTAIVAPNGSLKTGYEYDAFGSMEQSGDKTFLNDVTFTGSVTDKSTGLQYMNSRFYNSSTGRFLSQDTYTGNPYDPWTQHLYAYTGNNPVNFIDPTGHVMSNIHSLRAQKSDLVKQRDFRKRLVDGYDRMLTQYRGRHDSYSVAMYSLAQHGYSRNLGEVSKLNKDIKTVNEKIKFAEKNYDSADEAAIGWAEEIMPKSVKVDREYGGKIYHETKTFSDGTTLSAYGHSNFIKGQQHKATGIRTANVPNGASVVAYIHTHGALSPGYAEDQFSQGDWDFMNAKDINKPLYLVNITGNLRVMYTSEPKNSTGLYNGTLVTSGIPIS